MDYHFTVRERTAYILASAGTMLSASLSWFLNSPLFGVLTGILVGTLVTDFTQSRSQRRAVKRDLALKNIETIYSPLYKEIGSIQEKATRFNYRTGYEDLPATEWIRISSEYHYHFIDPDVKRRLIALYDLVSNFNRLVPIAKQKVDELFLNEWEKSFSFPVTMVLYGVTLDGVDAQTVTLTNYLLFGVHPKKAFESSPATAKVAYYVYYSAKKTGSADNYSNVLREKSHMEKFDRLYSQLLEHVTRLDTVKELNGIIRSILGLCPVVRTSILHMIQEPWSNL